MTKQTTAMKLALEALERYQVKRQDFDRFADEITALREALAQHPAIFNGWQPAETAPKDARILFIPKMSGNLRAQEPVNICWWSDRHNGWRSDLCEDFGGTEDFDFWMPLPSVQQPAQRTWVGLTDEEIEQIWRLVQANDFHDCVQPFARAIEAKLKEKINAV